MNTIVGKQSICFQRPPQIVSAASVVGKKESEGPLGTLFDQVEPDPKAGQATWEEAESALQKRAAQLAMQKAAELPGPGVPPVRYLFSGDRQAVRRQAANAALRLGLEVLSAE